MNNTINDLKSTITNVTRQVFKDTDLVDDKEIDTFTDSIVSFVKAVSDISKDTFGIEIIKDNDEKIKQTVFEETQQGKESENKKQVPPRDSKGRFIKMSEDKKVEQDIEKESKTTEGIQQKKSIAAKLKEHFNKAAKYEVYKKVKEHIIEELEKYGNSYEYDEKHNTLICTYANESYPDLFLLSDDDLLILRTDLINETGFSDVSVIRTTIKTIPTKSYIKICYVF